MRVPRCRVTVHLPDGESPPSDPDEPSGLDDSPIPDKLWDGLLAWMRGIVAVIGTALAIWATLGYPRRAPGELSGSQLAFLVAHRGLQRLRGAERPPAVPALSGRGPGRLCRRCARRAG